MNDDLSMNPPIILGAPLRSTIVEEASRESASHRSEIPSERERLVTQVVNIRLAHHFVAYLTFVLNYTEDYFECV